MRKRIRATYEGTLSKSETRHFQYAGVIVVVHHKGSLADCTGAMLTTALVALPGESTEDCITRHRLRKDPRDAVIDFNLQLEPTKE